MSKLKYGMVTATVVAAFVGAAGLSSLPQAVADDVLGTQVSDLGTQRAKIEYAIRKQECDTLKNSQPQGYESCLQKAQSTRDNLLTQAQGSAPAGQGSKGFASNQSQQFSGKEQGPIDKMTSAVKETVAEVKETLFGSSDQGRQGQPSAGQQGQGSGQGQGGVVQGQHPLQQGFDAGKGQDLAQQNVGASTGQGGQVGQQGPTQGQQPQQGQSGQGSGQGQGGVVQGQHPLQQGFDAGKGQDLAQQNVGASSTGQGGQVGQQGPTTQGQQPQQGQSGQGSFQGGNYGQQAQNQPCPQGTGGTNQQFQSGGTQGSSNQQGGSMSGSAGAQAERMDPVEYYQGLAHQQYATLKQECDTMKQDASVWEQCQQHAKSVRDKIAGMAEQG